LIRLIYWLAIIVETVLVLVIFLTFLLTDSRIVKIVAEETLTKYNFSYQSVEGNFFTGLKITALSYNDKQLFDSATLYWSPLTLLNNKITLKKINAQGVELENFLSMANDFSPSNSSSNRVEFDFSLVLNKVHLDIKPYTFEGVTFSDFLFETEQINLNQDSLIDTKKIYLRCNSDLVNLKLEGRIDASRLFVETLYLKEIRSKEITSLVQRLLNKKRKKESKSIYYTPLLKSIKIKYILATLKDVTYNPLSISNTKVIVRNGEIDPYDNYTYKAKKISLSGMTNFGKVNYKGYIKKSTIYAKGTFRLSKELFNRYHLPFNYEELKKVSGSLRLNHYGVWLDINHHLKRLLNIKSDFNLDVIKSEHTFHYNYRDNNLSIVSELYGKMPYAEQFSIKNRVTIDKQRGFRYSGEVDVPKFKGLPKELTDYLLTSAKGEFHGDTKRFNLTIDTPLLLGEFKIYDGYKHAKLELESKGRNISLNRLSSFLPVEFQNEFIALESQTIFDFKRLKKSKTTVKLHSNILNLDLKMRLEKPLSLYFDINMPSYTILSRLNKDIDFTKFDKLHGRVDIFDGVLFVKADNRNLSLSFDFDTLNKVVIDGLVKIGKSKFILKGLKNEALSVKSNISDIQNLIEEIESLYKIKLPNIEGQIIVDLKRYKNSLIELSLNSPHIKYFSKENIINIDTIKMNFTVDKELNVVLNRYEFKIDRNEYMDTFYADKKSFLTIKKGKIFIKEFWINDDILLKGSYDTAHAKANFTLDAQSYNFKNKDFDLLFDTTLNFTYEKEKLEIKGVVDILGNAINYEVVGSDIVEDADIIIVEDMLETKESAMKNLKLEIKINSKKEIKYIGKDTNIEFYNDLSIVKNYNSDVMVTGMTTITKGYYQMEDKYFILNESHIYFSGDPKKPLLDIKANYEKDEYVIHIFISGSTEEPIVNFTSEPYLTQQEILSLILFDGTGSSNGGGAEAYTLLGGTFAKGLIKSLGIDVDHLLLGTDANDDLSFEIGRRVSKNITVIYQHEDGKDGVKARIQHNRNFETDIIIQPPNTSSIEFLYKYTE